MNIQIFSLVLGIIIGLLLPVFLFIATACILHVYGLLKSKFDKTKLGEYLFYQKYKKKYSNDNERLKQFVKDMCSIGYLNEKYLLKVFTQEEANKIIEKTKLEKR